MFRVKDGQDEKAPKELKLVTLTAEHKSSPKALQYALVSYARDGKMYGGFNLSDIDQMLELLKPDEWQTVMQNVLPCLPAQPQPNSRPVTQDKRVSEARIALAVGISNLIVSTLVAKKFTEKNPLTGEIFSECMQAVLKSDQQKRMDRILARAPKPSGQSSSSQIKLTFQQQQDAISQMQYDQWQEILADQALPAVIVDLASFDSNVQQLKQIADQSGKQIRLATKSVRVVDLLKRARDALGNRCSGFMCFTAEEAELLAAKGMDNFFIAYPTLQKTDLAILRKLHEAGKDISIAVDCVAHLQALNAAMEGVSKPFPVVVDVDMSVRLGDLIDMGVRRSSIHTPDQLRALLEASRQFKNICPIGAMGYEAGAAAVYDATPNLLTNAVMKQVRVTSFDHAKELRASVKQVFAEAKIEMKVFNGGGSGTLNWSDQDPTLTEIAAGNAMLDPHIVCYSNVTYMPAIYVALQVTRESDPGYITCGLGGGIVASGSPGADRNLTPESPPNLTTTANEGYGEVQSPFKVPGPIVPKIGGSVLFRPTKGGEATQYTDRVLLLSQGKIVGEAATHRGNGLRFG